MLSNAELAEKILDERNKKGGYLSDDSDISDDSDEYYDNPKYDLDYFGGRVFFDEILREEKGIYTGGNDDDNISDNNIYSTDAQEIVNELLDESEEIVGGNNSDSDELFILSDDNDNNSASDSETQSTSSNIQIEYRCECCDNCTCAYKDDTKPNKKKCTCSCIECIGNKQENEDNQSATEEECATCDVNDDFNTSGESNIINSDINDTKLIGGYISENSESNESELIGDNISDDSDIEDNELISGNISDDSEIESNDVSGGIDNNDISENMSSKPGIRLGFNLIGRCIANDTEKEDEDDKEVEHQENEKYETENLKKDPRKIEMFDVLENKLPIIPNHLTY